MVASLRALTLGLLVLGLGTTPFAIAEPGQHNKMTACNERANAKGFGEGKGEERKAFMRECLSAKSAESTKGNQQNKMKMCNKEAGEKKLKGDERKTFMSTCLSS